MKLPELKKIFQKKYIIRVVAGALVVGLVATGSVQYTALADKAETADKTSNEILSGSHVKVSAKDLDKDETVYLISKPDGTVSDTIVADHLINKDGADTIDDESDLTDITNTNGDEKYTQDGNKVTWQADGNDIYYQGHTDKEAPVSVKVTYTLDGSEVTPEELAGKSGHVVIHYDYKNNTNYEEKVNGENVSVVVPFATITGMILNDDFTNVKVNNGRVIQNGTKTIAVGYALPGVKDSLEKAGGSIDQDLSIPDSFEVEADVKDFDLQTQMTAVIDASNLMTSNSKNMDDLSSGIDELQDATDQLKDGSSKLKDGASDLEDGASKLTDGSRTLKDGLGTLKDSMGTFTDGAGSLSDGLGTYTDGVSRLNGGIGQLKTSLSPLKSKMPEIRKIDVNDIAKQLKSLSNGVAQLKSGSDQLIAGYNGDGTAKNPGLVKSMKKLSDGAKSVSDGAQALSGGAGQLDQGISQIQSTLSGVGTQFAAQSQTQLTEQIDQKLNTQQVLGLLRQTGILGADEKLSLENIDTVETKFKAGQNQIVTAIATQPIKAGTDQTAAQTQAIGTYYTVLDGLHQVQAAKTALDAAGRSLQSELTSESTQSQLRQLTDGSKQLSDSSKQLADGAKQVSDGLSQANTGVKKLAKGQKQLGDGINTLNSSVSQAKIDKLDTKSLSKLSSQLDSLLKGVDQLYNGSSRLNANSSKLTDGASKLDKGADQISGGVTKLYNGSDTLNDGMTALYDGSKQLTNGAGDLYDGIVKFDKEGIEELVNTYNGDIKPLANRIRAAIDAGENYETFTGLSDGKNGAVKFLYRMDGITAPDDED